MIGARALRTALALVLAAVAVVRAQPLVMDLSGEDWSVSNGNGTVNIAATVPGVVTLDMMRAGLLGDPYYRFNEIDPKYRAVVYSAWTYTKTFTVSGAQWANAAYAELVFDGLDTVCSVSLNGQTVGAANNQFRRYIFDVRNALVIGSNVLVVKFESPIDYAGAQKAAYPYTASISDPVLNLPYRNFIRKTQSDFGWDWGPAFAPTGIYRDVRLVAYNSAYIADVVATQTWPNGPFALNHCVLNVTAWLRVGATYVEGFAGSLNASVHGVSGVIAVDESVFARGFDGVYAVSLQLQLPIDPNADLWWPVGYGSPTLFPLTVTWQSSGSGSADPVNSVTKRVGFRSAELVRETMPVQEGVSFYFRLNGQPVYAKGANFIPMDAFHPRVTATNFSRLLTSAVEANINIVRVWGGGVYQQDTFYDLADELGVLIWQEFAFACAMYPRDFAFLDNVRAEVHFQARRLSSHASLIIFGGNNENEAALHWYPEPIANRDLYLVDYVKLYLDTVRATLLDVVADTTEFVSSSPSNGPLNADTAADPYVQLWGDPQDIRYGDVHFYDYADDCTNVSIYPRARFVSEFGFQSHASFISYAPVTEAQDWDPNSLLFDFRQRHPDGNAQLLAQMQRHFRVPANSNAALRFDDYLYVTQAVQTMCYGAALSYWRSIMQETPGNTMGIIYWQLNDIWQGPTWSSTEYGGRWKMVHYRVKRVFNPLMIAPYMSASNPSNVRVYVVSDQKSVTASALTLVLELYRYDGQWGAPLAALKYPVTLSAPLSSQKIVDTNLGALVSPYCSAMSECFFWMSLVPTATPSVVLASAEFFLTPLAQVNLPPATIAITNVTQVNAAQAAVTVLSSAFAPFTWLETATIAGHFSDNGFLAAANTSMTVQFYGDSNFSAADLAASLKVRSVIDTYDGDVNPQRTTSAPVSVPAQPTPSAAGEAEAEFF